MAEIEFPVLEGGGVSYLDSAATSPASREALEAMDGYERGYRANVARGIYPWAERATAEYEGARATVARALGADAGEIVFTSGATAALNLAAGLARQAARPGSRAVVTGMEHHSNIVPWQLAWGPGPGVAWARCGPDGTLDRGALAAALAAGDAGVLAITHASNVTGVVNDVAAVAAEARAAGALVVVDGAQHIPHRSAHPRALGADFYAFSGHKCNGPTGIGVLWGRAELLAGLDPVAGGGGMVDEVGEVSTTYVDAPRRFEAGTPPIAQAIGLAAAFRLRESLGGGAGWEAIHARLAAHDARLREFLGGLGFVELLGPEGPCDRVPITAFNVRGCHAHDVCQALAEQGVFVRGGHHCAQPLMRALGVGACVRASLGAHVRGDDIDRFCAALPKVPGRLG